jgi:hypothetical protein
MEALVIVAAVGEAVRKRQDVLYNTNLTVFKGVILEGAAMTTDMTVSRRLKAATSSKYG